MSERFFDKKVKEFHELRMGSMTMDVWERIEFNIPKNLDTTLHKARLYYEHGKLRKENMNRNREKSKNFSDNCKLGFNLPVYRRQNNNFPMIKNFNKSGTKPYVPAHNINKPVASVSNATLLQIKC